MTLTTTPLSGDAISALLQFAQARYDALCGHIAEDQDPRAQAVRDIADDLVAQLKLAARWAQVPAPLAGAVAETIRQGRRLWEYHGLGVPGVRLWVGHRTPVDLRAFVLEEIYRDAPEGPDGEFEVAFVATSADADRAPLRIAPSAPSAERRPAA